MDSMVFVCNDGQEEKGKNTGVKAVRAIDS